MRTFRNGAYTCEEMTAYDALILLPKVLKLFPDDELVFIAENRISLKDDPSSYDYLTSKDGLSDTDFIISLFKICEVRYNDELIFEQIDNHFKDIYELFDIISWILEVSYSEALGRDLLKIPKSNPVSRADKIIKNEMSKRRAESDNKPKYIAEGVPPPNMNPWLFSVLVSADKNKRCDWELLYKFKTEFNLVMFMEIWECIESVKTYEAAEVLSSL